VLPATMSGNACLTLHAVFSSFNRPVNRLFLRPAIPVPDDDANLSFG